jgi:hypothetical protein
MAQSTEGKRVEERSLLPTVHFCITKMLLSTLFFHPPPTKVFPVTQRIIQEKPQDTL